MGDLVAPLIVVGVLLLLLLVLLGLFVLRRVILSRSLGTFDCSLRELPPPEGDVVADRGWMLGMARYQADRLEWFRIFTVSVRPRCVLARTDLIILDRRPPSDTETETVAVLPDSVIVRCSFGQDVLELAMSEPEYTGFATWLESAPPGLALYPA
jgi:hypothetical protein